MSRTLTLVPATSRPVRSLVSRTQSAWRSFWRGPYSVKDPALSKFFGSGYESSAGVRVTPENAFTFSAVFNAVNQIASDVAKLPLNLRKRREDGGSDLYQDSKLYGLLKIEPNNEMGSMVFRRTLVAHALTCKGGFAEIERDAVGRPAALWLLTPDRVEPIRRKLNDGTYGPLEYRVDGKDNKLLPARDMLHLHGLGYDGYEGYSVIDKARQTIGLAMAAESFGAKYFGKGTVFGGWLETDADLDEPQKADIRTSIEAFRAAQDSAFRILVTGMGHKFHQFDAKPRDSQMDELRIRQVEEVARFFRLPPYKLGVNTPGTVSYASVEAANLDYYTGCLLDWITLIEQELMRKLIPRAEWKQQFIKHNVNAFLRGTIKDRFDALAVAHDRGVINADDWLELEDMNPQPGGQGKVYLVQGAMVPKDQLITLTQAKIDEIQKKLTEPAPTTPAPTTGDAGTIAADAAAANDRAARAEQLLDDTRRAASEARERLAAVEATGTAQAAELERLRADSARLSDLATQMGLIVEFVRDRSARLEADAASARDAHAAEVHAREAAETTVATLRGELAGATDRVAAAEAAAIEAAESARVAVESAAAAALELEEARAAAAALATQGASDRTAREAAELAVSDAVARVASAEASRGEAEMAAAAARDALDRAEREEADREARLATAEATASTTSHELSTLRQQIATLEQRAADAQAEASRAAARLIEVEQAGAAQRDAELERRRSTVAAHRALIVDALGRMVRREAEQARRRMATPEKLRAWLDGFPVLHEAICIEALAPAVRTRLAWRGSSEDPVAATTALVRAHLAVFDQQLRAVLASTPEEFHAELERVLTRWETDRPAAVADGLLLEDLRDVAA